MLIQAKEYKRSNISQSIKRRLMADQISLRSHFEPFTQKQ